MSVAPDQLPEKSPHVICQPLPEGAVLFSTTDEVYFGLNSVGAKVWELLPPANRTLDELCRELERDYPHIAPDQIRADVEELIATLTEHGLAA